MNETLDLVRNRSAFYRRKFAHLPGAGLSRLEDIRHLPFTSAADIKENPLRFLCVSQSEIRRVVSLTSSGTTGGGKRVFFTAGDQELTVDFFHHGMSVLVEPGDRVLIMLPGTRPGSVGDLLLKALNRLGAVGILHGPLGDVRETIKIMNQERVDSLVGIPVQALALARCSEHAGAYRLKSVLLSTDYVPAAVVRELQRIWGCKVFNHYGMTEMGLGGGVECRALAGYHMREADLYVEIINPRTGEPVPQGEMGEVVFTTLTRVGMPLIRYRTGDLSRFIPERCPCGSVLRRMDTVKGRLAGVIELAPGRELIMSQLDEALFAVDGMLDFNAFITAKGGTNILHIEAKFLAGWEEKGRNSINNALANIPQVQQAVAEGILQLAPAAFSTAEWSNTGTAKRIIRDLRGRGCERNI